MIDVLIIGCGRIGALLDIDTHEIITHAKAFSNIPDVKLHFYDENKELLKKVSETYNADHFLTLSEIDFKKSDIVSVCTPTKTHFEILKLLLKAKVPVIVCEKPLTNNAEELDELCDLYHKSNSKILVNYIRRFQPGFANVKNNIADILCSEKLTSILVKYQRGFINNVSHAVDTLCFLLDKKFSANDIVIGKKVYDEFEDDPTMMVMCEWDNIPVCFFGQSGVLFSNFEIEINFEKSRISILNGGDVIRYYKAGAKRHYYAPLELWKEEIGILTNYMLPVANYAVEMFLDSTQSDNFSITSDFTKKLNKIININGKARN